VILHLTGKETAAPRWRAQERVVSVKRVMPSFLTTMVLQAMRKIRQRPTELITEKDNAIVPPAGEGQAGTSGHYGGGSTTVEGTAVDLVGSDRPSLGNNFTGIVARTMEVRPLMMEFGDDGPSFGKNFVGIGEEDPPSSNKSAIYDLDLSGDDALGNNNFTGIDGRWKCVGDGLPLKALCRILHHPTEVRLLMMNFPVTTRLGIILQASMERTMVVRPLMMNSVTTTLPLKRTV
jgi:hypothetical protein